MYRRNQYDRVSAEGPATLQTEIAAWQETAGTDRQTIQERALEECGSAVTEATLAQIAGQNRQAPQRQAAKVLAADVMAGYEIAMHSLLAGAGGAAVQRRGYERSKAAGGGTQELQALARITKETARAAREERELALAEEKTAQNRRAADAEEARKNRPRVLTQASLDEIYRRANLV